MRPSGRILFAAAVVFFISACGSRDPLGPAPLDQGIIVYMHSGFRGTSQQVAFDVTDLGSIQGPCGDSESESDRTWNDCISSVRVLPGWAATLYGDKNFRGASVEVTEDLTDLKARPGSCSGSYDDCISSIKVHRR
jgi:peptidase inhibitor family I36